jgi:hypothetical protein
MFQTKIDIPVSEIRISYEDCIMTLGSCFAENIGNKLKDVYFETDINPFGVLYNPVSIRDSIELMLRNKVFTNEDIFEYNSFWQSFSHSSLFTDISAGECLNKINTRMISSIEFLQNTQILLITFGTAWVFEEKKSGTVVSNCHKLPACDFIRRRLTVKKIVADYNELIINLQTIYPSINIIFSVSPIRHWKDGAHENNISKSILIIAIDELQKQYDNVHYFPAYEIQMDELRDYRFYAPDMLHPSEVAVDYIWRRFSETYFTDRTLQLKKRIEQYVADCAHRPFQPDSIEYKKFLLNTEKRKTEILNDFPFLTNRIH